MSATTLRASVSTVGETQLEPTARGVLLVSMAMQSLQRTVESVSAINVARLHAMTGRGCATVNQE